jgi:hypothetical protein
MYSNRDGLLDRIAMRSYEGNPRSKKGFPLVLDFRPERSGSRYADDSNPQYSLLNPKPGIRLDGMIRQFTWTWILALLTMVWILFTIYFAYNSSMDQPKAPLLIFTNPQNTILTLTILSHVTVLLLEAMTSSALESVRWAFACSKDGISTFSFLGLSRATGILGVLNLLLEGGKDSFFKRDGHRFWGIQRLSRVVTTMY